MIDIKVFYSGSKGNLYLVSNGKTKILLECGVEKDFIIKALWSEKLRLSDISACLVSHNHSDHIKGIEYVNQYLPIYANADVKYKCLHTIFHRGSKLLENGMTFKIGDIRIRTYYCYHGKAMNNCFIFKDDDSSVFFGTDFAYIETDLSNFKFTKIFIEVNYIGRILNDLLAYARTKESENDIDKYVRQINTHMALENAIELLKTWNLEKCQGIVAIHLSKKCADKEYIKKKIEDIFNIPCYCASQREMEIKK